MSDPAAMAEAQEQALGIFADAVLKLALDIQQQALITEAVDEKVKLAGSVHQLGRGLRQTLALQAKLAREARAEAARPARPVPREGERNEANAPADPKTTAVRRRRDWLTRGIERCVWNEYDREDETEEFTGDSLLEDFSERLSDLMEDSDAFLALEPTELMVQLCKELGLKPPEFQPPSPPVPARAEPAPADSS